MATYSATVTVIGSEYDRSMGAWWENRVLDKEEYILIEAADKRTARRIANVKAKEITKANTSNYRRPTDTRIDLYKV